MSARGRVEFLHRKKLGRRAWREFRRGLDLAARYCPGARDGLHVYAHRRHRSGTVERFAHYYAMHRGVPAVFYESGTDARRLRFPPVGLAAVFDHDCLSEGDLQSLVDAMFGAGIGSIFIASTHRRRLAVLLTPRPRA